MEEEIENTNSKHDDFDNFDIKKIFNGDTVSNAREKDNKVLDSTWVKSRYMVPDSDLDPEVLKFRYSSTASLKPYDTSIGGNIMINPRPQFNPLTDPKADNIVVKRNEPTLDPNLLGTGMGEGYSEMIDDNQQLVFLEFGLPEFNSLFDFFFRAVDYADSVIANTGRPSKWYNLGKAVGYGVALIAFPILSLTVFAAKFMLTALTGEARFKYYYMKPHMHLYWSLVNTLTTQLVAEQGLLNPLIMKKDNDPTVDQIGLPSKISQADIDVLEEMIPGIISSGNYIDVFAIVTKAQKKAIAQKELLYQQLLNGKADDPNSVDPELVTPIGFFDKLDHMFTFGDYIKEINKIDQSKGDEDPKKPKPEDTKLDIKEERFVRKEDGTYELPKEKDKESFYQNFAKTFSSTIRQGGAFAIFGVDYTGSTSESFSNSTTNINIGDKAKQLNNKSRALSYDLARGNVFGTPIKDATDAIGDILTGVLDSVTFNLSSVLRSIAGNAYVDVPKRWDDSSISLPTHTYTMQLRSPYNSFLSQLQNIYIPLNMLLAGVLPLATGKSSYTSPLLCSLFSRGVERVQMGMITSVSVTRGTTNLGFDKRRRSLGIDVTFKVTDFSNIIASPVNPSIYSDVFNVAMEDDTPLGNYMSVLGGRDIITSKYSVHRVGMRISKRIMRFEQTFNVDRFGFIGGEALQNTLGPLVSIRSLPEALK